MVLAAGLYRLTRVAFAPIVAAVAVFLLLTRFQPRVPGDPRLRRHHLPRSGRLGRRARDRAPAPRTPVFALL